MLDVLNNIQRAEYKCAPGGGLRVVMEFHAKPNRKGRRAVHSRRWNKKMRKFLSAQFGKPITELVLSIRKKGKEVAV
jgi:hypothetical protein